MSDDQKTIEEWFADHESSVDQLVEWAVGPGPASIPIELKVADDTPHEAFLRGDLITGMVIGLSIAAQTCMRGENQDLAVHCDNDACFKVHYLIDSEKVGTTLIEVVRALLDLHGFHNGMA